MFNCWMTILKDDKSLLSDSYDWLKAEYHLNINLTVPCWHFKRYCIFASFLTAPTRFSRMTIQIYSHKFICSLPSLPPPPSLSLSLSLCLPYLIRFGINWHQVSYLRVDDILYILVQGSKCHIGRLKQWYMNKYDIKHLYANTYKSWI